MEEERRHFRERILILLERFEVQGGLGIWKEDRGANGGVK